MDKENIDLKFILIIVAIIVAFVSLIWVGVVSSQISNFNRKISDTQTTVASLTSYMASTTSILNDRMAKIQRSLITQQSTISSLTVYVKNLYSDLSGKIITEDQKIADAQSNLSSLKSQIANVLANLATLSSPSVQQAPQTSQPSSSQAASSPSFITGANPSMSSNVVLTTVTATTLSAVNSIISSVSTYEVTQVNGLYYVAYPGSGVTYSIQILSSPYPDRVLALVQSLRSAGIPAFKIDYSTQSALFIGVFPTYMTALNYANSVSNSNVVSIVGSGISSWLVRQIP